ncbi:MAG: hypothetical protein WCA98_16945 [Candidatus Acidiferrales bacterium]
MKRIWNLAAGCGAIFFFAAALAAQDKAPALPSAASANTPPSASEHSVPPATPETLAKGNSIVLAAAKAAGGDALKSLKSVEVTTSGKAASPDGPIDITIKLTIEYPNLLVTEAKLPDRTVLQGFDGSLGWLSVPEGTIDLPAEYNAEFERGIALAGGWGLYRDAMSGKSKVQYLDEEEFGGTRAIAVQWEGPRDAVKLFFDPATHLLVGAHFRSLRPQGPVEVDQRWSDYRAVGDFQYPYHNVVIHDGVQFSETTVQDVKINPNLDPSIFGKAATAPAK